MTGGGEAIAGQAVARYVYGHPLNIKNVICIWAFIITVGMVLCGFIDSDKGRLYKKLKDLSDKLLQDVRKYSLGILLLEIAGICCLTAYICNNQTVHWDEAYTYKLVTQNNFIGIIRETSRDVHPPLYYLLVKAVTGIFGTGLIVFKLFSVFCSAGTMLLGATLIRKRWGVKAAALFILAAGLGPQFIYFAVDVRMYALQMFFVTLCALLAYEIFMRNRWVDWILFTLSALGAAYTHYFAIVPLVFIYGALFIYLLLANKKALKRFFFCCAGTISGYLPWVSVMLKSFINQGTTGEINLLQFDIADLWEWMFSTNIEYSVYMGIIALGAALLSLFVHWRKIALKERIFLVMCAANWLFSYIVCLLIASGSAHFWDNRYIFGSLGMLWLFIIICITRWDCFSAYSMTVWLSVIVLSAFTVQKAAELGTVDYVNAAHEVLKQAEQEEVILYNFATYDVIYEFHLPGKQFVYIDDIDFDELNQNYIYLIAWGGEWFAQDVKEKYQITAEFCGEMRFEEGMAGVYLYKVHFSKPAEHDAI